MSHDARTLPAEWAPQAGAMLCWPRGGGQPIPDELEQTFIELARVIAVRQPLLIACSSDDTALHVRSHLRRASVPDERIRLHVVPIESPWARESGPLTVLVNGEPNVFDFARAGVPSRLHALGAFGTARLEARRLAHTSGCSDGHGTLLTTGLDLQALGERHEASLSEHLRECLGVDRVLSLRHGGAIGDHDGRLDLFARFCSPRTIAYQACDDPADARWRGLRAMAVDLAALRTRTGEPYELQPLPWPRPRFGIAGVRAAAAYTSFVLLNGAVLSPLFDDPADADAVARLRTLFPGRDVIGIDSRALIEHGGSLRAAVMTLPQPLRLGPSTAISPPS